MKIYLTLLVVLVVINFSSGADSIKAKRAQNEARALINRLKLKAVIEANKLKNQINFNGRRYSNEMTFVVNTVSAEYRKFGVDGQNFADKFESNISLLVDRTQKGSGILGDDAITILNKLNLNQIRTTTIDPAIDDLNNLTLAINNNSANYDCFNNQKKSIQTIIDNLISQVDSFITSSSKTLTSNMTVDIAAIEAYRKKVVNELRACKSDTACGTKYFNQQNGFVVSNFTSLATNAYNLLVNDYTANRIYALTKTNESVILYQQQKATITTCLKYV